MQAVGGGKQHYLLEEYAVQASNGVYRISIFGKPMILLASAAAHASFTNQLQFSPKPSTYNAVNIMVCLPTALLQVTADTLQLACMHM